MADIDIWPVVHDERAALAADLTSASLGEEQWSGPSQCEGWSVRDVLAHMTATASMTPGKFFPKMIASGFSFDKVQDKGIAAERGASGAETLSRFQAVIGSEKKPPGPKDTVLGETIIHADDIRRSLGLQRTYPDDALVEVADFYKGSNLIIGTKRRIDGLALRATDTGWSYGAGPEVSGPMLPLLLAMAGRKGVLNELSGDGVDTLRQRA
ncbi:MAG TPA: maleylpyruvate isomerase family mycothiol-dependent enzyme [Acidimicrobiales bacterium]|jgi:uncharacterized protein (TIGR03083 family)|nr:maleylpyruvate isomerase family mycothiol-dependent enzyme [Acidimicrobiales bacterium]